MRLGTYVRKERGVKKIGKKNQIYAKWKRLLVNPDNPKELYIVIEKDQEMQKKYIREFENKFKNKDVIITITKLIRDKKKKDLLQDTFYTVG